MASQINNNNIENQNIIILYSDAENENAENAIALSNEDSGPLVIPELLEKIFKFTARNDQESLNNFKSFRQVCRFWHGVAHEAFLKPIWREVESFVFGNSLFKTKLAQINPASNENVGVSLFHFGALSNEVSRCAGIASNDSMRILPSDYQKLDTDLREALLAVWQRIQPQITFEAEERIPVTAEEIQSWLNDPQNSPRMDGITSLGLSFCGLKILPPEIGNFRQLQELYLSNNELTTLPDTIGNLSQLRKLYLSNNQLTTLPDTIGKLENLQDLTLSQNQLTTLPDTIGNLGRLQKLDLSNNQITTLPDTIGNLAQLRGLYLLNNQITTLPDTIGNLGRLQRLDLINNQLTTLPDTIGNLGRLRGLHLQENQITTLPDTIGNLGRLRWLYLLNNQITALPDTIGKLGQLRSLYLSNNQITALPDNACNFGLLEEFKADGNTWVFIFDKEAAKNFNKELFFKQLADFTNYPTSSKLGKFFRAIGTHDLIAIKNSFNDLDESVKRKIEEAFCKKAGILANYVDLFTDMGLLARSAHKAIRDLYRSLDEKQQELVRMHVWNLAGRPNNNDPNWDSTHLFDHLLRFSDALETVVSQSDAVNQ